MSECGVFEQAYPRDEQPCRVERRDAVRSDFRCWKSVPQRTVPAMLLENKE